MPESPVRCCIILDTLAHEVDASAERGAADALAAQGGRNVAGSVTDKHRGLMRKLSDAFFDYLRNLCL